MLKIRTCFRRTLSLYTHGIQLRALSNCDETASSDVVELHSLISELSHTSSKLSKIDILKKYPNLQGLLQLIYHPYLSFNVSSRHIQDSSLTNIGTSSFENQAFSEAKEPINCAKSKVTSLKNLLEELSGGLRGNLAQQRIGEFMKEFPSYEDTIKRAIDRHLKVHISVKSINAAFPSLIPEFNVALAQPYSEPIELQNYMLAATDLRETPEAEMTSSRLSSAQDPSTPYFLSRKLDGVRCLARVETKFGQRSVSFFSRAGHDLGKLQHLSAPLLSPHDKYSNFVLDGELCVFKDSDLIHEDFIAAQKLIAHKSCDASQIYYAVFDMISINEYDCGRGNTVFYQRQNDLRDYLGALNSSTRYISGLQLTNVSEKMLYVEQFPTFNVSDIQCATKHAADKQWEGWILRKNVGYEGKRTRNMMKIKQFEDEEFIVKDIEVGYMTVIEDGKSVKKKVMTSVKIEHKSCIVSVGSGFCMAERYTYCQHPEKIIGQTITVQYMKESSNEKGGFSLKFPTVKFIHGARREY